MVICMLSESKLAIICKGEGVIFESGVKDNVQFIGGRVKDPWNHIFRAMYSFAKGFKKNTHRRNQRFLRRRGCFLAKRANHGYNRGVT